MRSLRTKPIPLNETFTFSSEHNFRSEQEMLRVQRIAEKAILRADSFSVNSRANVTITLGDNVDFYEEVLRSLAHSAMLSYKVENRAVPNSWHSFTKFSTAVKFEGLDVDDAYTLFLSFMRYIPMGVRFTFDMSLHSPDGSVSAVIYEPLRMTQQDQKAREPKEMPIWQVTITSPSKVVDRQVPRINVLYNEITPEDREQIKSEINGLIDGLLAGIIDPLSTMYRYSDRSVTKPQSVIEHVGSVTIMSLVFSDYFNSIGIVNDRERVISIAALHEADEAAMKKEIPRDIKYDPNSPEHAELERLRPLVRSVIPTVLSGLMHSELYERYIGLYAEEEERSSIESCIVKLADIAETFLYSRRELALGNAAMESIEPTSRTRFDEVLKRILELHAEATKGQIERQRHVADLERKRPMT